MANKRKKASAADAQAVQNRKEAEAAMGVERGTQTDRRVARGTAKGGVAATAAKRLKRIKRAERAGSRGPFKAIGDR